VKKCVNIDPKVHAQLRDYADRHELKMARFVERAIAEKIERDSLKGGRHG